MIRLKFKYTKTCRVVEEGECFIDVPDSPTAGDIQAALTMSAFARYLPVSREEEDVSMNFQVVKEDNDG